MKRKFLITNDVGLSKDKIDHLVECLDNEYDETQYLSDFEYEIRAVQAHLQKALENLGEEE